MYTIITVFNNNVILAKDTEGNEYVFMGKGIGFSQSSKNPVDSTKIEKKFKLDLFYIKNNEEYLETIRLIVEKSEEYLDKELNDYIYYSLADHIDYAIERHEDNVVFRSPIQWEIKKAYPKEYRAGEKALAIIKDTLGVQLPSEEVTFLTLHIINASNDVGDFDSLYEELTLIDDVIRIIKHHFKFDIDEESSNYERFLTHLKFFIHRIRKDEQLEVVNYEFYKTAVKQWPDVYDCLVKINKLILKDKNVVVNNEESFYLMLHINRLINRKGDSL